MPDIPPALRDPRTRPESPELLAVGQRVHADSKGFIRLLTNRGTEGAILAYCPGDQSRHNARRIAACVNACRNVEGDDVAGDMEELRSILATAIFPGKSLGDHVLLYECADCHNAFIDEAFPGRALATVFYAFASGAVFTAGAAFCADCAATREGSNA